MEALILLAAILAFYLVWVAIDLLAAATKPKADTPPAFPLAAVLHLLEIGVAVWWLWQRYLG